MHHGQGVQRFARARRVNGNSRYREAIRESARDATAEGRLEIVEHPLLMRDPLLVRDGPQRRVALPAAALPLNMTSRKIFVAARASSIATNIDAW